MTGSFAQAARVAAALNAELARAVAIHDAIGTMIRPRAAYEGKNGWHDGRLGQAYDLLDAAMRDHPVESPLHTDLKAALDLVESIDCELEKLA